MNKKGILFDMDGTLINTYAHINYKDILNTLNPTQKTLITNILKDNVRSFSEVEKRIHEEMEEKDAKELIQIVHNFLSDHYIQTPLKHGAIDFLTYLKKKDYTLCLCTNNATDIVSRILEEKGIASYFDYTITSQQVSKPKPDPQMYLEALHAVGLQTQDCIVFEDSETGILSAKNADLEVIVVNEEERSPIEDVTMVIKDFSNPNLYEIF